MSLYKISVALAPEMHLVGEELDRQGLGVLSDETCVERQRHDRVYDARVIAEVGEKLAIYRPDDGVCC